MINKITIQNFKSIKDKVEIDLKPITLLFGPNSAGKSTVVQAIHYMKEILERNNTDPGKTDLGGEAIDLGGFANLVHRKEGDPEDIYKNNPIVIGFQIQENDLLEPPHLEHDLLQNHGYDTYYVEFTIEWDDNALKPIVKKYDVHINGEFIGRIEMSGWNVDDFNKEDLTVVHKKKQAMYGIGIDMDESLSQPKYIISNLNLLHKNLQWDEESFNEDEESEIKINEFLENLPDTVALFERKENKRKEIQKVEDDLELLFNNPELKSKTDLNDKLSNLQDELESMVDLFVFYNDSAIPSINRINIKKQSNPNQFKYEDGKALDGYSNYENLPDTVAINDTLTQIFCTPILFLREVLSDFCYIGPLRKIPDRLFNIERTPMGNRWSGGLGAWDKLYRSYKSDKKEEKDLIKSVNKWLAELDTGYNISVKEYKEIEANDPLAMGLDDSGRLFEDGEDVRRSFENYPTLSRLQLIEEKNLIEITAKDIGAGIAQVLPIIVATVGWEGMLFAVEQPELHVHPAIQQKLADMLIPFTHHNRFILLETHSEHIMLRLLRRIEETTENELPVPEYELKPDDVSVVYVEPTDEGVEMTQLPIDETGEFTKQWPRGFFEERAEDLF